VGNNTPKEKKELITLSRLYDAMHDQEINKAIAEGKFVRWNYEKDPN
jgi:hypothetical protein